MGYKNSKLTLEEIEERNKRIISDDKKGASTEELMRTYRLTKPSIVRIIREDRIINEEPEEKKPNFYLPPILKEGQHISMTSRWIKANVTKHYIIDKIYKHHVSCVEIGTGFRESFLPFDIWYNKVHGGI